MEDEKGYVYILTNPAFQEDWVKIGMTKDVDKRVKDLSNKTCLPYAFDVYAWCKTILYKEMEKQVLLDKSLTRLSTSFVIPILTQSS